MRGLKLMMTVAGLALASVAHAQAWQHVAGENGAFSTTERGVVRFGIDTRWNAKEIAAGQHNCDLSTFTSSADPDPAVGVVKVCQFRKLATAPACWMVSPSAKQLSVATFPSNLKEWGAAPDNQASWSISYWCATKYGYRSQAFVGYRTDIPSNWSDIVALFNFGSDASRADYFQKHVGCTPDGTADPCARYKVLMDGAIQKLGFGFANLPPIEWVVAKNSTTATRPMYPILSTGLRGKTATTTRAIVGAPCDCMGKAIEESTSSYCPILNIPQTAVTLCTLKK